MRDRVMSVSVGSVSFDVGRGRAMGNGDGMTPFWYFRIGQLVANEGIVYPATGLQYRTSPLGRVT